MGSDYHYNIINPNFDYLGYISAIANVQEKHDRSAPSNYHWKILKCRMIIFSNSSILACPDKTDIKRVHVIFSKVGDEYDKLNSFFEKFSLSHDGGIKKVDPELFQMCFQYTLIAKLAPVYNTIGYDYLIRNRYFLTSKGHQEGLKFKIWSNEITTTLELKPVKITLIRPNNVCKPGEWVRVLPSLNKAIIEDYYEHLPENGSFKYYKDMRRHWKNIHGYRLPDEECPYYAIRFWRGEPLTYPKICVVQNYPIITPIGKVAEEDRNEKKSSKGTIHRGPDILNLSLPMIATGLILIPDIKSTLWTKIELMKFICCMKQKMQYILGIPLTIKGLDHNSDEIISHEKPPETQLVSLCTPTQDIVKQKLLKKTMNID